MRCNNCSSPVSDTVRFCGQCGADLAQENSPRLTPRTRMAEEDETLIWTGSFSAKGLIHSWLLAVLISIVLPVGGIWVHASPTEWLVLLCVMVLVWFGLAAYFWLQKLNVHYELTNHRLIHRSGILLRRTNRIELIDMNDVSHEQGIIERIFNVGTIEITSSDRSHPIIDLPGIANVNEIAMLLSLIHI